MRRCAAAIACVAVLLGPSSVLAASAARTCRKSCTQMQRACVRDSKANLRTARSACGGEAATRKACRRGASALFRVAKRNCRDARQACRGCCRTPSPACSLAPELPLVSGAFPAPDRSVRQNLPLPPAPGGRGLAVLALPDGVLAIDPADRTPVSAAAECASAMLACFAPPQRNWAGCFAVVPVCTSDTPWLDDGPMCCAAGCAERYQEKRRRGLAGAYAFTAAVFEPPSCMPGLPGAQP